MRGLYLAAVVLHVLAAMTWMGGMVIFVTALLPVLRRQQEAAFRSVLHDFSLQFRVVSWVCLVILVITGTVALSMRGVQLNDFLRPEWRSTPFGRLVLVKVSLVLVALTIAFIHERVRSQRPQRLLGRSLLLVGIAIVIAAVAIVRTP